MSKIWRIQKFDGADRVWEKHLPGDLTESEVSIAMQRLVCRNLSEEEILDSSLQKNSERYRCLLERIGQPPPLHFGETPSYTADLIDDKK